MSKNVKFLGFLGGISVLLWIVSTHATFNADTQPSGKAGEVSQTGTGPIALETKPFSLPEPRQENESKLEPETNKPTEISLSPTGNGELDVVYRANPKWARRWDKYKAAFVMAQNMRTQPPSPPEHPRVDEERFRVSQAPPHHPFSK